MKSTSGQYIECSQRLFHVYTGHTGYFIWFGVVRCCLFNSNVRRYKRIFPAVKNTLYRIGRHEIDEY